MPGVFKPVRLGLALVMLGAGGCYLQVPTAASPDLVVNRASLQVTAADVEPEPDADEHLERHASLPEPPWGYRPAPATQQERSGEDWAKHRQLELDEQMRRQFPDWQGSWCPLVLSFDGRPVRFEPTPKLPFETGGPSPCASTDWPTASTPWLVRDLDANGTIDGGHELFGTGTRMPDQTLATSGFEALGVLDANGDGRITAADPGWSSLALWRDHDRDRKTGPGELQSLDDAGVRALVFTYTHEPKCDERGNCMIEHSTFEWVDHQGDHHAGAIIDIHLACRRAPSE